MEKNKMATAPVGRLMLGMGIPMILSMMLQAVYNIVDSAFVANMPVGGEQALEAGIQSLVISVCRQFVFVLPVAWGFSQVVKNQGTDMMWLVWLTFLIAEGVSAVIALALMKGIRRKRIDTLE